jgi:dihydroorotate dehydrogenase
MPDWTYHPFFKPVLFRFPGEDARRATLALLAFQAKTRLGRRIFRLFGHGIPPRELAVEAFGITFPAPIGVAPGIDIDADALAVLQYLGVGFVAAGPAGEARVARSFDTDPIRIREALSIATSEGAAGPSAAELARKIAATPSLEVPVAVALRGPDLAAAARAAEGVARLFFVPAAAAEDEPALAALREATRRPLVLRLSASWDDATLDRVLERALAIGIDGCVAVSGEGTGLLPGGSVTGPFLRARRREVTKRVLALCGERLPIVASGGILTPDDALEALDDGARLVELYEGLVYGGPALPGRIVHRLEHRVHSAAQPGRLPEGQREHEPSARLPEAQPRPAPSELRSLHIWGCRLVAFTGLVLAASGITALVLASTVTFFPYDFQFLGMTAEELCLRNACKIVHFMKHDRVSFGGAILAIGIVYVWLAQRPLRRGEPWAFWILLASGLSGFASFLLYLGYGYLDVWHGWATLALSPFYLAGMALAFAGLTRPRSIRQLFRVGAPAYAWSPSGMGRTCLTFAAAGMIGGGLLIMIVGVTRVFVDTDLAYMGITVAELDAISPKLVPLIAHDRSGFGGGLFSGGLAILASIWCGSKPGATDLWWTLLAAGAVGFGCAIGVHPLVGYTSFVHLLPAYLGALAFLTGMALLHRPMCRAPKADRFSEFG